MQDKDVIFGEIRKYLFKLRRYITKDGVIISLFGRTIIKKKRLDDILVCIEASFPEQYKKHVKNIAAEKLESHITYTALKKELINRTFYSGEDYVINQKNVLIGIDVILKALPKDLSLVLGTNNNQD